MVDLTDLIEFIRRETGEDKKEINLSTLIEDDLGITGEDGYDLIRNFSKRFRVDISEFDYSKYFYPEPSPYLVMKDKILPLSVGDLYRAIIERKLS